MLRPSPTPSFGLLSLQLPVSFFLCAHQTACLSQLPPSRHISPSPCRHPEEVAVSDVPCIIAAVVVITITVIISQMRRAKIELCPFPSGWLTVISSSFIHCAHHFSPGQRRPERQEAVELPPRNRGLKGAVLCTGVSSASSVSLRESREEAACHTAMPACQTAH